MSGESTTRWLGSGAAPHRTERAQCGAGQAAALAAAGRNAAVPAAAQPHSATDCHGPPRQPAMLRQPSQWPCNRARCHCHVYPCRATARCVRPRVQVQEQQTLECVLEERAGRESTANNADAYISVSSTCYYVQALARTRVVGAGLLLVRSVGLYICG